MNTHADKTQENKSRSVANHVPLKQSVDESTFLFVDKRPETTAQRRMKEIADDSPRAMQLKTIQELANNNPQAKKATQLQAMVNNYSSQRQPIQKKQNETGLPDNLKSGIERLSDYSMDDVNVHYNSDKPTQLNAHAFTQGTDIHLAAGQEKQLPHEAWHVVQQKQGRVKPTMQLKGKINVNNDAKLEKEADEMGARTTQIQVEFSKENKHGLISTSIYQQVSAQNVVQLIYLWDRREEEHPHWEDGNAPKNYLPSGKYNDSKHGEDNLYERLGEKDLFYGINYEENDELQPFLDALVKIAEKNGYNIETPSGVAQAVAKYEEDGSNPLLDVVIYKAIFGGSSGWDRYSAFLPHGSGEEWGSIVKKLNPSLKWSQDITGSACQIAIINAISQKGSVRFLLDGMSNIRGILAGTAYQHKVTSNELIYTKDIIGKTITLPDKSTIQPQDGINVFFYLNRELVKSELIYLLDKDSTQTLARRLAIKIAEEEEWNEFEEEVQKDILKLKKMLHDLLSIPQILELLSLP